MNKDYLEYGLGCLLVVGFVGFVVYFFNALNSSHY